MCVLVGKLGSGRDKSPSSSYQVLKSSTMEGKYVLRFSAYLDNLFCSYKLRYMIDFCALGFIS